MTKTNTKILAKRRGKKAKGHEREMKKVCKPLYTDNSFAPLLTTIDALMGNVHKCNTRYCKCPAMAVLEGAKISTDIEMLRDQIVQYGAKKCLSKADRQKLKDLFRELSELIWSMKRWVQDVQDTLPAMRSDDRWHTVKVTINVLTIYNYLNGKNRAVHPLRRKSAVKKANK